MTTYLTRQDRHSNGVNFSFLTAYIYYAYKMRMAEFQSSVPGVEKNQLTYDQVLQAVFIDVGTAENAYARIVKSTLPKLLTAKTCINNPDEQSDSPIWVDHKTAVFRVPSTIKPLESGLSEQGLLLFRSTMLMAKGINETLDPVRLLDAQQIWFVEPTWVRIQQVSADQYSFSIKQKWSVR